MAAPTPAIPQDHSQSEQSPYEHLDLDPSIYNPSKESVDFFKKVTGISDDDELKQHIIDVQKDAWHVSSSFIFSLSFLQLLKDCQIHVH